MVIATRGVDSVLSISALRAVDFQEAESLPGRQDTLILLKSPDACHVFINIKLNDNAIKTGKTLNNIGFG